MGNKQIPGQMSIFDILEQQKPSHDLKGDPDYQGRMDEIVRLSIENDWENTMSLYDCECGEAPVRKFISCHDYFIECPKCLRRTETHPKMYKAMQAWNRHEVSAPHPPQIHRYLRYGPHTLIPKVRVEAREWLDRYGVPDWVEWTKDSLPCANCTWWDGTDCCSAGHTNHYEYGYLICDGFYQSIVEGKPSTVGDSFPSGMHQESVVYELDIRGICDDPYCPQCGRGFWTESQRSEVDCERCPDCHVRISWARWHKINDKEESNEDPG